MHCPSHTRKEQRRRSTERADIFQLLDPSYASTSTAASSPITTVPPRVFVDASGTIHDPEFRFFPTDEWKALDEERRRSFDLDDDDDEENVEDEDDYAFGGRKTRNSYRYNTSSYSQRQSNMTRKSSPSLYTPSSPSPRTPTFSYNLTVPSTSSSTSIPSASSSSPKSCTPIRKIPHLFRHRRPSHEFFDEDADLPADEEEEDDLEEDLEEEIPRTPELIRDYPLEADEVDEKHIPQQQQQQQQSSRGPHRDLRSKLQVLQLTVQFAAFRVNKRLRKSRVGF